MEKLKFIIPVLLLFTINSCIVDRTPDYVEACFTISGTAHTVNDPVYFVNCSQNAVKYEWSFGDGFTSNQRNPTHYYDLAGTYQVTMTAYDNYGNYQTFMDAVTIIGSTDLDLLIMFEGTQIVVPRCEVTIYDNEDDYQNFGDIVATGLTDNNGIIVFTGLDPIEYYIDAYYEGDGVFYSNYELGYITDPLIEDEVNEYNIYVRQYQSTKEIDKRSMQIVKIEKSSKEEHEQIIKANSLK